MCPYDGYLTFPDLSKAEGSFTTGCKRALSALATLQGCNPGKAANVSSISGSMELASSFATCTVV